MNKQFTHIAIDGPVAAGKGTIAAKLAKKLGYLFISTGAMYRAVAFLCIRKGVDIDNETAIVNLIHQHDISLKITDEKLGEWILLIDNQSVMDELYKPEISRTVAHVSKYPKVREYLVKKQIEISKKYNVIMEGRDIGSVVLPDAAIKIYLTADVEVRAKRRYAEIQKNDADASFEQVLAETKKRDELDMNRTTSPLKIVKDAIIVDSTDKSIDEVVNHIIEIVNNKHDSS